MTQSCLDNLFEHVAQFESSGSGDELERGSDEVSAELHASKREESYGLYVIFA